jgi:uncharacterized membrane protein YfcA
METLPVADESAKSNRYIVFRTIAAAFMAGLIGVGVSALGHSRGWPHPISIAFAVFLFLIPILDPPRRGGRLRSWRSRLTFGVVIGLIGGLFNAFVLDR